MDRNKGQNSNLSRGPKKITQQPPEMFIALGAKQSTSRDDPKRPNPLQKPSTSSHTVPSKSGTVSKGLKREISSSSLTAVTGSGTSTSKKLKVGSASTSTGRTSTEVVPSTSSGVTDIWETLSVDCEPSEFFETTTTAINSGNMDRAVGLLLGAIRTLKTQRQKMCKILYSSLLLLCRLKPNLFCNDHVVSLIVNIIRKDVNSTVKPMVKNNTQFHVLFTNILMVAYIDVDQWDDQFVKLYVEDAVADRILIDNPYCRSFIENIATAFNTKSPPASLLKSEAFSLLTRDTSSPLTINIGDDDNKNESNLEGKNFEAWKVKSSARYKKNPENVEKIALEVIKEQLARKQQPETTTKNFVRFLSTACGLIEIRMIAVSRLENWLHNHKLMKPAQELLAYLCFNCTANSQRDLEIIAQLSKMRLKNKPMVNFFNNCLREMVSVLPENLYPLLKYTIYNELSNARNPNNLLVVGALFQVKAEASASAICDICMELLLNKDDYLRSLRALLKEINRVLRFDFNLLSIVRSLLLQERKDFLSALNECEFKDRIFLSIIDLVTMCMLLGVSPQVREASTHSKRDTNILRMFQQQVGSIQRDTITWLHDTAVYVFRPNVADFHHAVYKVMFLEQAEQYYKIDSWPGENERIIFLRLVGDVPVQQQTIYRLLLMGISKEHPISANEILEICDQVIRKCANLPHDCLAPLHVDNAEIIELFFKLCAYNYPDNITLPVGYQPPILAITNLYWKVMLILVILVAHNPDSLGNIAWTKYPILKMLMEMCITNHFLFPPPTMSALEDGTDYLSSEQQTLVLEKQKILELECHLAAASTKVEITEQNSLLLPQLIEMRPDGRVRRPPALVLDQLGILNTSHRLGHLLCRSRHPDFLLDIMSRQGGTAHMPWLADLVLSSEGSFDHLPVQCLCEYLLSTTPVEKIIRQEQLLKHLKSVVNEQQDPQIACEVLEYLLRRLTCEHGTGRTQAIVALNLILSSADDLDTQQTSSVIWLTHYIHQFQHYLLIKPVLIQFLRQALQIETVPTRVSSYINFLTTNLDLERDPFAELHELVTDLSAVVIERHSVASYVLPGDNYETLNHLLLVFTTYIRKARQFPAETLAILQNYSPDYVLIRWANGDKCHMLTVVIHASIVLITYDLDQKSTNNRDLLNSWFPTKTPLPRAYSPETNEEVSYIPDWMKLRMIRSNVERLVDAAIDKLEPSKLILFLQSFGIPTPSVSKLLQTLDKAVTLDSKPVVDSVLDKSYMIQLVHVQNARGALGGHVFINAIKSSHNSGTSSQPESNQFDRMMKTVKSEPLPIDDTTKMDVDVVSSSSLDHQLNSVFALNFDDDKTVYITNLIRLCECSTMTVSGTIFRYLKSVKNEHLLSVFGRYNSASRLLQLVLMCCGYPLQERIDFVINLAKNLRKIHEDQNELYAYEVCMHFLRKNNVSLSDLRIASSTTLAATSKEQNLPIWYSSSEKPLEIQDLLLFSKAEIRFRPLLMSLILQHANWKKLFQIKDYILKENGRFSPVAALDFLLALHSSPKMWQGRDKNESKHHTPEDIFNFSTEQVQVLFGYILDAARVTENWREKMQLHLNLVLKNGTNYVPQIRDYLQKHMIDTITRDVYMDHLYLIVYMALPCIRVRHALDGAINHEICLKSTQCNVDETSHCILSALTANPLRLKDWQRKSKDLEVCARKLCATHPLLMLRQLSLLGGALKGRAQYDWTVFRNRSHFLLFTQVLGLLELLQPIVFENTPILVEILDSYCVLLQYHGHLKECTTLVQRLLVFLQNWIMNDIGAATQYLKRQIAVLTDLESNQPTIRYFLSTISLPLIGNSSGGGIQGIVPDPRSHLESLVDPLPAQWPQIVNTLEAPSDGTNYSINCLGALQELEYLTVKKPQLLIDIRKHLYRLLLDDCGAVRTMARNLIIRWLKHDPNSSVDLLPMLMLCLNHGNNKNPAVVNTILDRLPELVVLMQEYGRIILEKVFDLGLENNRNVADSLSKCFTMLKLQSGV